jgi:aspartate racemase
MRMIGMLGGMSWESSAEYYRLLNEETRRRRGGHHCARCLLASVDFADVVALQRAGAWAEAGTLLAGHAQGLERAGAELLILSTNLMHKVAPQIEAAVGDVQERASRPRAARTSRSSPGWPHATPRR